MRLTFMGTPEAAVHTLRRCVADGHQITSVWTQPDRPSGRHNRLTQPPVKVFALEHGLTIRQPVKLRNEEALQLFSADNADAAVVVAYGRILPSGFLQALPRGCINVHFSLLPLYRGAAPVNWAIIRGEIETGVTTLQIEEGLDTGPILLQRATKIGEQETARELMERLSIEGAELLSETLSRLDDIVPRKQDDQTASLAPLLHRDDGLIDWALDAFQIERRVRGLQPWPNAYTSHRGTRLLISRARAERIEQSAETSGTIIAAHGDELSVVCGDNTILHVNEVQPAARRSMTVRDFLNGAHLNPGEKLG